MESPQRNNSVDTFKVIIIGGGIGGLTFARCCLDRGLHVELYEKRSRKDMLSGPGGIFIQHNAMRVFELIANGYIKDQVYKKGGTILSGGFLSEKGEPLYINTPKRIAGVDDLGACILRPELQDILLSSLKDGETDGKLKIRNGFACSGFEDDGKGKVKVMFENGEVTYGNVLVGADGVNSVVRARLEKKDRMGSAIYSGTCCWRGFFDGEGIPLGTQYSWAELWGRGNRFGYFDVGDGRYSFYAFDNVPPNGNDDECGGASNALKKVFSDFAEPVPSILKALEKQNHVIYRDDIGDRLPLGSQWATGQVTLIGDAAHPCLPSIGQGGCMAIEDSFELAKRLAFPVQKARNGGGDESVANELRKFEADRSNRTARVFKSARDVGQIGQASSTVGVFLRNWMYKLMPGWLADLQFKWLFDYHPTLETE